MSSEAGSFVGEFMPMKNQEVLERLADLNVARVGSKRYPHKALLLLIAVKHAIEGKDVLSFEEVERELARLLKVYAPPAISPNVKDPYWRLRHDGVWQVDGVPVKRADVSTPPPIRELRASSGRLIGNFYDSVRLDTSFREKVVSILLEAYFPETLHEDIIGAVGIDYSAAEVRESANEVSRTRDPYFRVRVLAAYDYRCAVTGFQAALGGTYFGCEAAHVKWHAYDGPDRVENGLSLEPTMHKLFDVGAWSLSDDRRILVSADFTGSDYALDKLRSLHGKQIAEPAPGNPAIDRRYIRWHREKEQGGIFRAPSLPL
jgi:putative restriction endonuclease